VCVCVCVWCVCVWCACACVWCVRVCVCVQLCVCSFSLGWCEVNKLGPFRKSRRTGSAFRMLTRYILTVGEEIKQFGKKLLHNNEFRNLHRACLSCRSNRRNR